MRLASALWLLAAPALAEGAFVPQIPAQEFTLDPAHSSVTFRVDHIGFSTYTGSFDEIAGRMRLDVADPASAELEVTIPVASLDIPAPPEGFLADLLGPSWFDAQSFPQITFASERVEITGENTALIHGLLTFHGVIAPVTLDARYNGGWDGDPFEPGARLGFSATAEIARSAFDMSYGLPNPPIPGVGDTVWLTIETEWMGEKVR